MISISGDLAMGEPSEYSARAREDPSAPWQVGGQYIAKATRLAIAVAKANNC